jgi:protein TIF31
MFPITVLLPHGDVKLQIPVSIQGSPRRCLALTLPKIAPQEQVHEVRQSIIEMPDAIRYSCFHLELNGEPINDFAQISDVKGLVADAELRLVEAPYTEKEARIHFVRIRELIGAAGDRPDTIQGLLGGLALYDDVVANPDLENPEKEYDFTTPASFSTLLPRATEPAPKTVKGISLSAWNPPPAYWRQKGHLLYLLITTNEGEQHQVTAHVGGFFVNKSSNTKFDPLPRLAPKDHAAHSLLTLIEDISPSFSDAFEELHKYGSQKEPHSTFQRATPCRQRPGSSPRRPHQPALTSPT